MPISEIQVEALTFIEQQYLLHGQIPTVEAIAQACQLDKEQVRRWMSSDAWQQVFEHKGMKVSKNPQILSPLQLVVANMMLSTVDRRSVREKLSEAGVSPQQYAAWRRDPHFAQYMATRAEEQYKDIEPEAYLNVMKNVQGGDLNAAKFYFEMTGKYRSASQQDFNLRGFLASLVEILQVRVNDPQVGVSDPGLLLELVAGDIEVLIKGGRPILPTAQQRKAIPVASVVSDEIQIDFGGV